MQIKEMLKNDLSTVEQMLIYNYYIENGSMKNFQKHAPELYKKLSDIRTSLTVKEQETPSIGSVTEMVETYFLEVTDSDVTLSTQQLLKTHFETYSSLTGVKLDKNLDSRLRNLARKNGLQYEEFKSKLETGEIYPKVMLRVMNPLDIGSYKSIIQSIVLNILEHSKNNTNVRLEIFRDFTDAKHVSMYEPNYLTYLRSRIPVYKGPIPSQTEGNKIKYIVQGNIYYGERDLKLETISSILDDILFSLKGVFITANLTPSIGYKLSQMLNIMGNLNYIGLDGYNLFQDLNEIANDLGLNSIADLLRGEGMHFEAIQERKANFVRCQDKYELILSDFDGAQIYLEPAIVPSLSKPEIAETLRVVKGERDGQSLTMLVADIGGNPSFIYPLISQNKNMLFIDGNTLNLTRKNLTMEAK